MSLTLKSLEASDQADTTIAMIQDHMGVVYEELSKAFPDSDHCASALRRYEAAAASFTADTPHMAEYANHLTSALQLESDEQRKSENVAETDAMLDRAASLNRDVLSNTAVGSLIRIAAGQNRMLCLSKLARWDETVQAAASTIDVVP